jgi:Tol biopolymer transport system component
MQRVVIIWLLATAPLPSSAKLLLAYGRGDISVYEVETRRTTRLTHHPALDSSPSWSGDGRHIAFGSERNGEWDVYTMRSDGTNIRQRTRGGKAGWGLALSPNGRYAATGIKVDDPPEKTGIAVIDVRTGTRRVVTTGGEGMLDTWPSWFPDNERVLFARRGAGVGLYEVGIGGDSDERFIVRGYMPSMGQDGRRIAHIPRNFGQSEVYIYDTQTGIDTLVPMEIPPQLYLRNPRWADPDRLVVSDAIGDVHLVNIATGEHETLPLAGESAQAFDTAHPWDVSAGGKAPFTWGWLKSLGAVHR